MSNLEADRQFAQVQSAFFQHAMDQALPRQELDEPRVFYQSEPVRQLLEFGLEHDQWLEDIVQGFERLGQMDVYRGCLTAFLIGLYGEQGFTSPQADLALADFFVSTLAHCRAYQEAAWTQIGIEPGEDPVDEAIEALEEADFDAILAQKPDAAKAWAGMGNLSMGLMSRLARNRQIRDRLRQADGLITLCSQLDGCRPTVGFVPRLLEMAEQETALLIAPAKGCGVEVSMEQIDSNNVFFSLLQFALYHKGLLDKLGAVGFTYREVIERIALHEPVAEQDLPKPLYDQGCFSFYTYPACHPDGSYDQMGVVWGEGNIYEVPKLDGRYVILLDRPAIQRSWGNAFIASTHPGLRPRVEVLRELSSQEVQAWLEKVRAANTGA